ncbi:MAG: putative transposase [Planctomycetota bacterium]
MSRRNEAQAQLFSAAANGGDAVFVNEHVSLRTQEGFRVVTVGGVVLRHYAVGDRMAERHAMVSLVEAGHADQNDVARAFDCTVRTLRRDQARFEAGGLVALGRPRGRPPGARVTGRGGGVRDRKVLEWKAEGRSNRAIAKVLGVDEKAVRKRLRRLGWTASDEGQGLLFSKAQAAEVAAPSSESATEASVDPARTRTENVVLTLDPDPLDRKNDRLLAQMGFLDDAAPLFAKAERVPRAGALLAIPALVESGAVAIAEKVYGSIGPAFYGTRTTIVALVLLALMRIKRPEALKEHAPRDLGRVLGLDRAPEVKTVRRKLADLAAHGQAERFARELAERRVAERGRVLGFLYVDGHVRVYHGKHTIPKTHVARMRLSLPATSDYWVNDQRGDPLFVVTAEANAGMVKMLPKVMKVIRALLGKKRRSTIVFDRGGWSPKLFASMIAQGFDVLTYRKGRIRKIAESRFVLRRARLGGRAVEYRLHDQAVRLLDGKLRMRQVTRLTDNGHQTTILTSRTDLRDVVVAYRMFERWRQENFFKYLRDEYAIDTLSDYQVEPDDPARMVPNPSWIEADKALREGRAKLAKLAGDYGVAAIDNPERSRSTIRGFKIAHGKLGREIRAARAEVERLERRRARFVPRMAVGCRQDTPVVKLATERKLLTNVLKMVAYQIESDLLNLVSPHYKRTEEEGRTLVQTAIQSSAALDPSDGELRVALSPLSSAHRSRAIAKVCDALTKAETCFPGTGLKMRFAATVPSP